MSPERRNRANQRERRRISKMNGMFDAVLNLLPPSRFKTRLSRAEVLREAAAYISRLRAYLETSEDDSADPKNDAITQFPHIFNQDRKSNKDVIRRPLKTKEGGVSAFISSHDLPTVTAASTVTPYYPIVKPTPVSYTYIVNNSYHYF